VKGGAVSVKDKAGALGAGEWGRRVLLWESLSEHRTVGFFPQGSNALVCLKGRRFDGNLEL